tara:strand:- start:1867 stop:2850 length:984 start_codon:yes stop_codon:yes gene_type:complete
MTYAESKKIDKSIIVLPNDGNPEEWTGETGMSNQCMFISLWHYIKFYHPDTPSIPVDFNIRYLRDTIGKIETGENEMTDTANINNTKALINIANKYNLFIRVWTINYEFSDKNEKYLSIRDTLPDFIQINEKIPDGKHEVNIASYGAHFQLIIGGWKFNEIISIDSMPTNKNKENVKPKDIKELPRYGFIGDEVIDIDNTDPDIKQLLEKEVSFIIEKSDFNDSAKFEKNAEELIKFTKKYYDKKNKSKIISKYLLNNNDDIEIYIRDNDNYDDIKNKIYFRFLNNNNYELAKYKVKIEKIGNNIYVGNKYIFKKATNIYFIIKLNI